MKNSLVALLVLLVAMFVTTPITLAQAAPALTLDTTTLDSQTNCFDGFKPVFASVTESYRSKYVSGAGVIFYDHASLQTDIFVKTKSGIYADIWFTMPSNVENIGSDYGTELDLTLGYGWTWDKYNFSLSLSYYDINRALTFDGNDIFSVIGKVSRDFKVTPELTLSPFLRADTNFKVNGKVSGDTLPRIGIGYAYQATSYLTLCGSVYGIYDPGCGGKAGPAFSADISLNWKLDDHWKIELPYFRYVKRFTENDTYGPVVFGSSLTYSF